jgi:prevent-host-death family protein
MLNATKDTQSLSHFKRKTSEVLAHLKETGEPIVLTVKGKAELVVQDAESYRRLAELAEKAEMIEFLRKSREDVDAGRTLPMREALDALRKER